MRHFLTYGLLCLMSLGVSTSCVSNGEYDYLRTQYDSLALLNLIYQDQAYETDSLVLSIIADFQEISHIETMINVNSSGGNLPASEQRRIRRNVRLLSERLEQSNKSIDLLLQRMEGNSEYAARMHGTITFLKEQLRKQKVVVDSLTTQTLKKLKDVQGLEAIILRLRSQSEHIRSQNEIDAKRLKLVEDSLNVVYYAMGTKDDLKEMRLVNKQDRVSVDNAEISYLTQGDRRNLHSVNMMSRTARLLTIHPRRAYKFAPDDNGALVLEILDPKAFWAYSQIMLAEVDF